MALTYLMIDGVRMPTPSAYTPVYSDFDSEDSARGDESGRLNRTCIRFQQFAPKFKWQNITTTDLNKILLAIKNKASMTVACFDPVWYAQNGGLHEFTGYVQATRQPEMTLQAERYEDIRWTIELSFIEY